MSTMVHASGGGSDDKYKIIENPLSTNVTNATGFTRFQHKYVNNDADYFLNGKSIYCNLNEKAYFPNYNKTLVCPTPDFKYDIPDISDSIVCATTSFKYDDSSGPEYGKGADTYYTCYKITQKPVKIYSMETGAVIKTIGNTITPSNYTIFPVNYSGSGTHGWYTRGDYSGVGVCIMLKKAISYMNGCWYVPVFWGRSKQKGTGNIAYNNIRIYKINPNTENVNNQVTFYEHHYDNYHLCTENSGYGNTNDPNNVFVDYGSYVKNNKIYIYLCQKHRPTDNVSSYGYTNNSVQGDTEICYDPILNTIKIYKGNVDNSYISRWATEGYISKARYINGKNEDGEYLDNMIYNPVSAIDYTNKVWYIYSNQYKYNIDETSDGSTPFFIQTDDEKYQKYWYPMQKLTSGATRFNDGVNIIDIAPSSFNYNWIVRKPDIKKIPYID